MSAAGRLLTRAGFALLALAAPTAALADIGGAGAPLPSVPGPVAVVPSTDPVAAIVPTPAIPAVPAVAVGPATAPVEPTSVPTSVPPVSSASGEAPVEATTPARTVVVLEKRIELRAPAKPAAKAKAQPAAKAKAPMKAKVKRKVPFKSQARVLMQAAGTTFEQDIPIGVVASSCSGDSIATSGNIHLTIHTITSDSGVTHFTATSKWDRVTGTSMLTGKRFASDTVAMSEATLAKGEETTSVLSGHFIVSGDTAGIGIGDDFYTHMIMHMTVSASGVPAASVNRLEAGCR